MKSTFRSVLCYVCLSIPLYSFSQKLPDKQTISIWAQANIKIDGKAAEWSNKYRAHNNATDLYYTLANNDNFLYLVIHAENPEVIQTLTTYGFKYTIQAPGKQNIENTAITVEFPLQEIRSLGLILNKPGVTPDSTESSRKGIMNSNNNALQTRHKSLIVKGVRGIDTLSVYNDAGIRVAEGFDVNRNYTLEIMIPLKLLPFLNNKNANLTYHLFIIGHANSAANKMPYNTPPGGFTPEVLQGLAELELRLNKKYASTDFSGYYTLAKIP